MTTSSQLRRIAIVASAVFVCVTGLAAPASAQQRSGTAVTGIKGSGLKSVTGDERTPVIEVECKPGQVNVEALVYTTSVRWRASQCVCDTDAANVKQVMLGLLWANRDQPKADVNSGLPRDLKQGQTDEVTWYCYDYDKIMREFGKRR